MATNRTPRLDTKQIPRDQWKAYFDRFTRKYLRDEQSETATIEVESPTLGDQFEVEAVPLLGIDYDPKSNLFELQFEEVDHLVFEPAEIWVIEGEGGFISTLEMVRLDGTKEIIYLRRSDSLASDAEDLVSPA